eukprot:Blabericola_migrator_1__963@NODE_1240_length_5014_cov_104_765110_g839_i0_p1_GENE_NODE_1240_length_5014_cov_104_765110_g839_i0NODE_1240_length_5014_cov_104_765110_g839_i0_p1_ORF_typecomplete_len775_score128_84_NODE_1240_length_5014_cov_104_765110_g839_i014723796
MSPSKDTYTSPHLVASDSDASTPTESSRLHVADNFEETSNPCPYGFPMPFYLCEKYGGLPIVLREHDACPLEGKVWLRGDVYEVGALCPREARPKDRLASSDPGTEWIINFDGEVVKGLPLLKSDEKRSGLYYLLSDNNFYEMASRDGQPLEGYVHHPENFDMLIPVGIQCLDEHHRPIKHTVFCMDGEVRPGISASREEGWSTHYITLSNVTPPPGLDEAPAAIPPSNEPQESDAKFHCTDRQEKQEFGVGSHEETESDDTTLESPGHPIIRMQAVEEETMPVRKITEAVVEVGRSISQQIQEGFVLDSDVSQHDLTSDEEASKEDAMNSVAQPSCDTRVPESSYDSTRHLTLASGDLSSVASGVAAVEGIVSSELPGTSNPAMDAVVKGRQGTPTVTPPPPMTIVRHVTTIETPVHTVEEQFIEKVVEVKQPTQIKVTPVEVPLYEDKITYRPHKHIIEVPVEVIREVKKPIVKPVEQIVEVAGHQIEVLKPYPVRKQVPKHIIHTKHQMWQIKESSKPVVVDGPQQEIECVRYEPEIHYVDVLIPKRVHNTITPGRTLKSLKVLDNVPTPHWNTMVYKSNERLAGGSEGVVGVQCLPFTRNADGIISVLPTNSYIGIPIGAPYSVDETSIISRGTQPAQAQSFQAQSLQAQEAQSIPAQLVQHSRVQPTQAQPVHTQPMQAQSPKQAVHRQVIREIMPPAALYSAEQEMGRELLPRQEEVFSEQSRSSVTEVVELHPRADKFFQAAPIEEEVDEAVTVCCRPGPRRCCCCV